ncbi:MAG: HDIG domain-containing protein [Proteobacteria bacterium]|nr:HDIG domain-containing protein [Pseudomonadota bacterium]MBU1546262.1 HDIG domain-containing protein [Pseudomonadota bacterium]MBU2618208.1 HDIG domain-containing protein [Pseudomonadota bacterium]
MEAGLTQDWMQTYPEELRRALGRVASSSGQPMYVAGGPVRDWLLGVAARDLDFTVPKGAVACAREVGGLLGGTFVLLDEGEDVARVVWQGLTLDFSGFRNHTTTIEEDLGQRDFTINAMAVALAPGTGALAERTVIDPCDGAADLAQKRIRVPAEANLLADPLRLLRAYRFAAALGFAIEPETERAIAAHAELLADPAMERVAYELGLIMASDRAGQTIGQMGKTGILWVAFPELVAGRGLVQPASHHLDVFEHSLEALRCLEKILKAPEGYFPGQGGLFVGAAQGKRGVLLKWAALFHDLGKPETHRLVEEKITFYSHDQAGAAIFAGIAERLHWPKDDRVRVARLIGLHMWPFHLSNARLRTGITRKACLRLVKAVGDDLDALFLLAMADSLAGQGPGKPEGMERNLAALWLEVRGVYEEYIRPVFGSPPLITGHDLIAVFALAPGPLFKEILDGLEMAQVEGQVTDRKQAMAWVRMFLDAAGSAAPAV